MQCIPWDECANAEYVWIAQIFSQVLVCCDSLVLQSILRTCVPASSCHFWNTQMHVELEATK